MSHNDMDLCRFCYNPIRLFIEMKEKNREGCRRSGVTLAHLGEVGNRITLRVHYRKNHLVLLVT
jgi:hypothetical protein